MEKTKKRPELRVKIRTAPLCFSPFDDEAKLRFRAMNILNEFKYCGYVNRVDWLGEVFEAYPEMDSAAGFKTLQAFWNLRYFGIELMDKLELLIDNLKEEA